MDIRLQQAADGTWSIERDGVQIHAGLPDDAAALATISDELLAEVVDAASAGLTDVDAGLLPETWTSPALCFTAETGPHRTFENCVWSSLDPATQFMGLYLSTTQEGGGHLGARLAGYFTDIDTSGPVPTASGRFFDNDAGEELRDYLLGGRRFGISVDPTEDVTYEVECLEMDPDGMFCVEDRISFLTYQIGGATATPQPGFADAYLTLTTAEDQAQPDPDEGMDGGDGASEGTSRLARGIAEGIADGAAHEAIDAAAARLVEHTNAALASHAHGACCDACAARSRQVTGNIVDRRPVTAAAGSATLAAQIPVDPPREWFDDPHLDGPTPFTMEDNGRVYGHLACWEDCHVDSRSYYQQECLAPPHSRAGYAYFHTGALVCDDGTEIAVGRLTVGGGHADHVLSYRGTQEHYDNVSTCFADVRCGEDDYGIWVAGALRPDVTPETLRIVRASPPSGDWRPIGAGDELVLGLSVNTGGFPRPRATVGPGGRRLALTAAGTGPLIRAQYDPSARLAAEVADLRAVVTRPMRDALRGVGADRARERLRRAAPSAR